MVYSNMESCDIIASAIERYQPLFFPPKLDMQQPPADGDKVLQSLTLTLRGDTQCPKYIQLDSDESCEYHRHSSRISPSLRVDTLTIAREIATVEASTVWGLLRGLETFSQLIYIDEQNYVRPPRAECLHLRRTLALARC